MQQYLDLLQNILDHGVDVPDRTGHGRRRLFSPPALRFDLSSGEHPLVTTRKLNPLIAPVENLMFISGNSNISMLNEHGVKIWDPWAVTRQTGISLVKKFEALGLATPEQALHIVNDFPESLIGEIGPMYGVMWRCWPKADQEIHRASVIRSVEELPSDFVTAATNAYESLPEEEKAGIPLEHWLLRHYYSAVDQLNELIWNLRKDPYGSRHVVTAFNPEFTPVPGFSPDENVLLKRGSLMPCHFAFQCFVTPPAEKGRLPRLSLKWLQRSCDCPVGIPQNIAGYAFLLRLLAQCVNMEPFELVGDLGDAHIYLSQIEDVKLQLTRKPLPPPTLWINPEKTDLFAFTMADVKIMDYQYHDPIKYAIAV